MNLNRAMIIGNLVRDPEMRTTATGQNVANFSIATSSKWKDAAGQMQERTEYHNLVAWGKLADICGQYLAKGRKAYVEGRLQTREWEAQDGAKRQRTEIVADNVILLDKPGQLPAREPSLVPAASMTGGMPASSQPPKMDQGMGDNEIRIEDIPF